MAEYDLVIRGGTIVDGTGIPRYKADLAVKDGRVAKISGNISPGGAKEIDASGSIVAPGVIDLHTHYDAQVQWDPYCSLSGWFGVTSITIGECGFGFAPTKPADQDLNMRMMNRIEAIPLDSMRKGMRWDWETFPQFLESLDGQGLGINVGALVPFSPLRGYVLGMIPARERTSMTETELNQMKQIFYEGMKAGGFGFSLDKNMEDRPEDGSVLPSIVAPDEEFYALAEVLGKFGVGHMGMTLGFGLTTDEHTAGWDLMKQMVTISGRPFHLLDVAGNHYDYVNSCRAEGLPVLIQGSAALGGQQYKLAEYNMYDYMPSWIQPLLGSPEERAAKLRVADRDAMKADVEKWPLFKTDWSIVKVLEVVHERNHKYEGLTVNQVAELMGVHPIDALFDLSLDEDLETEFIIPLPEANRSDRLTNPYLHVSQSDGGAHVRFALGATFPMWMLAHWCRDEQIMSLEQAHYKMSALPAWFTDFKERGTLRVGNWADIMVYNLEELGFLHERPVFANDFPGGERRLIQKPKGMQYTIVNGTVTFEGNDCTGALPGRLLRSYDMVD